MEITDGFIHQVHNKIIRKQANRYFIPIPEFETASKKYVVTRDGGYILSLEELSKLKNEIRKEKSAKIAGFVTIASMFTGIIGAATGLIAIIFSR